MNLMRFKGQHIIVFHLMDPEELTFPFGGTVKFAGLEGEDELKVQPDRLRADYLEEVELLKTKINKACRAVNADYVLVDTGRPIQDVLVEYLNTRKALHWHR